MNDDAKNRPCVRITLRKDGKDVSHGTGTLLKGVDGFYVITAHHCIYGDKNVFHDIQIHQIIIEKQPAFNASFQSIPVDAIFASSLEDDWAVIKVRYEDTAGLHPPIKASLGIKVDDEVVFTGFQYANKDEYRSFKSRIMDGTSHGEFRITLADKDVFKAGRDHAVGLSGSGAFLIRGNDLILIGLLKKVKGDEALNNDIVCCSIEKVGAVIGLEFCDVETPSNGDNWGSDRFEELVVMDKRGLMEKIMAVNSNFPELRMKRMVRNLALGKSEMLGILPRDMSAIKFRIFDKCREILENFVEENVGTVLTTEQIEDLIEKFTERGLEIIQEKSKMFTYPILDRDLMGKIILDLINECYLSFDKEGVYATG